MSESYIEVIKNAEASNNEIFNVGDENHSVNKLAEMVNSSCPDAKLIKEKVVDQRSYKISSDKIFNKIGFKTKKTISDAINDLVNAFETKTLINTFDDDGYYNIKIIKQNFKSLLNDYNNNLKSLYKDILKIRIVEEGISDRYSEQEMRCPIHLSIGQEAIAVVCKNLNDKDQIVSNHRCQFIT